MGEPRTLLTQWAALLVDSLAEAGVEALVMSPGSRSTPFVAAACAARRLRFYDVIDERAAAFFALGQARATGRPSLLVCTSGSAGAHYLPAIIEAGAAGLPMIVLTADRPLELVDCGAPQTIDQTKLFGDHVRRFFDVGVPDARALSSLPRVAAQAYAASMHPRPGAVHINARARKPLEPVEALDEADARLAERAVSIRARGVTRAVFPRAQVDARALTDVAALLQHAKRGLLVCGPMRGDFGAHAGDVLELGRRLGLPVLAETTSQLRLTSASSAGVVTCDHFDTFLRIDAFRRRHAPDVVLQLGSTPTSSAWEQFVALHPSIRRVVLSEHEWVDPSSDAAFLVFGSVAGSLAALLEITSDRSGNPRGGEQDAWAASFAHAEAVTVRAVEGELARAETLTEGAAVRSVLDALPERSVVVLGNSLPIRAADAFGRRRETDVRVFCQRGANGIDGLVAGACGAASAQGEPVTLLLGDVSLLHDLSSLMLARHARSALVIVVVNNRGGRIFEQLPLGRGPSSASEELAARYAATLEHIATPHDYEFAHAAEMFGHRYVRTTTRSELEAALSKAYTGGGTTLVEVIVPPSGAVAEYRRLTETVTAELGISSKED